MNRAPLEVLPWESHRMLSRPHCWRQPSATLARNQHFPPDRYVWSRRSRLAGNAPDEFAADIKAERAKWRKIVRDANIKLN